ncbi:unnamed protein product [Ceutorhynchus assimilis]|uniref:Uncharacterized protein n=1 Tax=Ceutorhynchus assimilis TaxID=467358 RepID=A0A9P0DJ01_9CUCU|nr:unnamed protein product [Ceutorhynchus assimilis]
MTQSSKSSLKKGFSRTRLEEIESTILHNKDSLGSVICSDEEEEEERHGHIGHEERHNHIGHAECSRIELFETTNLCLQTDTGQEFVISLTVSPKDAHGFGDGSYRKSTTSIQKQTYFADDTYIPLVRTKVCSSLDFDVKTVESRLRNQGQINNKNNKIVVRLQDFGTENLLRACRPAKCCRKAILNEKLKKCLPYSASIGSLPLDEADFDVIGESLEMSLQKVKNSTNLRKSAAYNSSNMYFNSVYSVMYLLVDDNQSLAKHKLDYYIYLVDDMRCNYANYDVYYFGVQHSFHQPENREEKQTASNRSLDKEVAPNRSNPFKWMKEKYNKYQTVLSYPQELISQNDPLITRNRRNIPESIKRNSLARNNKLYSSRIPIPVCKHEPTSESSSDRGGNGESDQIDVNDIDDASLTWQLQGFIGKKYQDSKQDRDSLGEKIAEFTEQTDKRYSICNYYEKIQNSTKSSVASNILKNKRKRKEFYLPRSSSDMSTPKQMCKLKSNTSKNKPKNPVLSTKRLTKDTSLFSLVNRDSSKLILKYFTKVLHEMIMKQMIKDKFLCQISEKHMSVAVGTEKESLQEIYRNQNIRKIRNENNSNISFHDLKAKQPQVCLTQVNSVKTLNRFNTIGMQTSRNIGQSKQSQTSNTLLDTFFQMEKNTFKRELIFKQLYNYSKQNSCDEVENFTVAFASNQSFSDCDFMTSESQLFDDNGNYTEETLEASLNKLKETLVKYEIVKREIDETTINPIEYFVYHLCACDSILNRKPTMMQRILSKTKGLFSAVENSFKLKNPICPTCGCNISNCQGQTSNAKPFLSCTCPEEFTKPKIFQPCCKKQAKTKSSTIAAQIKKSICDLFVSHKKLEPCKCTRSSQYGDAVYIPGKNSNKKNVLVGTTQKCGCVKCENFNNEDGTCCCSHCLGCLDKCFETSPENKSIAIEADVSVGLPENEKSKEVKETNAAVALVDTNHALSTIKDDLVVSDDKIVSDDTGAVRVHENEEDPGNRTDTQTYFFMGPTPQFLRSGNENPFQQYLLNFPNFSMFQVENLEDNFRR